MNELLTDRHADSLGPVDEKLAKEHLVGQWVADRQLESFKGGPNQDGGVPFLWKWQEVYDQLQKIVHLLPEFMTARRHLSFLNPVLTRGTTHTLSMGIQLILPGELAWAHRHAMNAMRFVIQGDPDLYTVVNGIKCPMEDYDLVATPAWTWHDHHNQSDHQATWLDVLDVSMLVRLNQGFYETLGETQQDLRNDAIPPMTDFAQPAWPGGARTDGFSRLRFPWKEAYPKLRSMEGAEGSPYDGVILEYLDPMTARSPFRTMQIGVQMLRPGEETKPHRHTSCALYFAIDGEGTTVIEDREFRWDRHDGFCLPNWHWHHHVNRSNKAPAYLFWVSDRPMVDALGFYLEENRDNRFIEDKPKN